MPVFSSVCGAVREVGGGGRTWYQSTLMRVLQMDYLEDEFQTVIEWRAVLLMFSGNGDDQAW